MNTIDLSFGVFEETLEEQLERQGYCLSSLEAKAYQKAIDGLDIMSIKGLVSESELKLIEKRIKKSVSEIAQKIE